MKDFLCLFLLFSVTWSFAFDCDSIKGLAEASIAFKGKVQKIVIVEQPYSHYEISFQVNSWIKGKGTAKSIIVDTPCLLVACCGIEFQKGEIYLVYAYEEGKHFGTNNCWATRKLK